MRFVGGRVGADGILERLDLVPDLEKFLEDAVRTFSRWAHHLPSGHEKSAPRRFVSGWVSGWSGFSAAPAAHRPAIHMDKVRTGITADAARIDGRRGTRHL